MRHQPAVCPMCGHERLLWRPLFPLIPAIEVCAECVEAVLTSAGCAQWASCHECPLYRDGAGDDKCGREPFPLHLMGYDPERAYRRPLAPYRPRQLAMEGLL